MGRKSCLRLIPCVGGGRRSGGGADEDRASTESKSSSDKRRWSFRKKSDRTRAQDNSVISEPISIGYTKESPEATTNDILAQKVLSVPDKAPMEEPSVSSVVVNTEVVQPLITDRSTHGIGCNTDDSVAIVIQAAIRGYSARREFLQQKSAAKLQAAVRGHLVRRQAIGTLRCVLAIIKLQALVRARHAIRHSEESVAKDDETFHINTDGSMLSSSEGPGSKVDKACSSTEALLSNIFARELLESAPKTKHIHIKCNPSSSDSSWNWLERWMAITSSDKGQQQGQSFDLGYEHSESTGLASCEAENKIPVSVVSTSSDSKLAPSVLEVLIESEGYSLTKHSDLLENQPTLSASGECFSSVAKNGEDLSHLENKAASMDQKITSGEIFNEKTFDSVSDHSMLKSNEISQPLPHMVSDKPEFDNDISNHTTKKPSCEPLENEGGKFLLGSRKPLNPAFVAVQSKFEELSSTIVEIRSANNPLHHTAVTESKSDGNSRIGSFTNSEGHNSTANSGVQVPRAQIATSECGTEISISSTLVSPDISEVGGGEVRAGSSAKPSYAVNKYADSKCANINDETMKTPLDPKVFQPQRVEESKETPTNSIAATDMQQAGKQKVEVTSSGTQSHNENSIDPRIYRSSPEGTPRSRTTVPESHETPSSQISVNAKKRNNDKVSTRKQKPRSAGKKSPSNQNHDSNGRSSTELFPKESDSVKRRNSFGMSNPDHAEHEPRISSSNFLPSYMQATESARAKAHTSMSPKSSPDVHDKEAYPKKRHSLPIVNCKQGSSPRMQRSASQTHQSSKGNGSHSHNSAERRWQR